MWVKKRQRTATQSKGMFTLAPRNGTRKGRCYIDTSLAHKAAYEDHRHLPELSHWRSVQQHGRLITFLIPYNTKSSTHFQDVSKLLKSCAQRNSCAMFNILIDLDALNLRLAFDASPFRYGSSPCTVVLDRRQATADCPTAESLAWTYQSLALFMVRWQRGIVSLTACGGLSQRYDWFSATMDLKVAKRRGSSRKYPWGIVSVFEKSNSVCLMHQWRMKDKTNMFMSKAFVRGHIE